MYLALDSPALAATGKLALVPCHFMRDVAGSQYIIIMFIIVIMYLCRSIYLSQGSKPVGVDCVAIDFSRLIFYGGVICAPPPTLNSCPSLGPEHFWLLWRGFGVCLKQKSRTKCKPRTWQSNGRERYNYSLPHIPYDVDNVSNIKIDNGST